MTKVQPRLFRTGADKPFYFTRGSSEEGKYGVEDNTASDHDIQWPESLSESPWSGEFSWLLNFTEAEDEHALIPVSPKSSETSDGGCREESSRIPRYQRPSHRAAELRRRDKIKVRLDEMKAQVPSLACKKRTSETTILTAAAEYTKHLMRGCEKLSTEAATLRQEIKSLSSDTELLQEQLPATGLKLETVEKQQGTLDQRYHKYVTEGIMENWKFYLFDFFMAPLFDAYKTKVTTDDYQSFKASVEDWTSKSLGLTCLRHQALERMRDITRKTDIMSHPEILPQQAMASIGQISSGVLHPSSGSSAPLDVPVQGLSQLSSNNISPLSSAHLPTTCRLTSSDNFNPPHFHNHGLDQTPTSYTSCLSSGCLPMKMQNATCQRKNIADPALKEQVPVQCSRPSGKLTCAERTCLSGSRSAASFPVGQRKNCIPVPERPLSGCQSVTGFAINPNHCFVPSAIVSASPYHGPSTTVPASPYHGPSATVTASLYRGSSTTVTASPYHGHSTPCGVPSTTVAASPCHGPSTTVSAFPYHGPSTTATASLYHGPSTPCGVPSTTVAASPYQLVSNQCRMVDNTQLAASTRTAVVTCSKEGTPYPVLTAQPTVSSVVRFITGTQCHDYDFDVTDILLPELPETVSSPQPSMNIASPLSRVGPTPFMETYPSTCSQSTASVYFPDHNTQSVNNLLFHPSVSSGNPSVSMAFPSTRSIWS